MPSNQINFEPVFSTSYVASTKDNFKLSVLYMLPVRYSIFPKLLSVSPLLCHQNATQDDLLLNLEKGEHINETDLHI